MRRWWEREPGRLAYELQALERAGIPYETDEGAFAAGVLRLHVHPQVRGATEDLTVTFPDLYPYFRFAVQGPPTLGLTHHQAPLGGGALCILGRSTEEWRTSDTVAGLLTEQLPKVVAAGESDDKSAVTEYEAHQAEPFSAWYAYAPAMLQIDGAWKIPERATEGSFNASVWRIESGSDGTPLIFGAVQEVLDQDGCVIAAIDERRTLPKGSERWVGQWVRATAPIPISEAAELFQSIGDRQAHRSEPTWNAVKSATEELQVQLRAALFPEEHAWRDAGGQGWVFVLRGRTRRIAAAPVAKSLFLPARPAAVTVSKWRERYAVARAGRSGLGDLARRVPFLTEANTSTVAIVGLGCLGAPSALEFARAQVAELRIMDGDVVEPGTVVRWPFGLSVAGLPKGLVVADAISRDYPYTRVVTELRQLGAVRDVDAETTPSDTAPAPLAAPKGVPVESEYEVLERFLKDVSLVYDASAEFGVQYFLSEYARARSLPYLSVAGTPGGWGGRVVRIRPSLTKGCWVCLQTARLDGSLPDPPADPTGLFQAAGCADLTFTAAGYDMVTIAMQGVRMAMSVLCGRDAAAQADDFDLAIISFRDEAGRVTAPVVKTYELPRHASCPACAQRP